MAMASRDGAASIQGDMIRVTPLNLDGSIDDTRPILTTNGFISASFGTEFEDGDEITEKAADGTVCIQYKADDSLKGITFNLTLCTPDPEMAALIAGGKIICAAADIQDDQGNVVVRKGDVVGYSSPTVGATVGNPVAVEIWSKAIVKGKPASGTPYWHWAFPYVRVRYEGDREFSNGSLANEYSGTGVGNEALTVEGLNPANSDDDYVTYKEALVNPFSYVRSPAKPDISQGNWTGGMGNSGQWDKTAENSIACVPPLATGATAGTPGSWTPADSTVPLDVPTLAGSTIQASPGTAWTAGQYVQTQKAGTAGQAYWNGTAWVAGKVGAPAASAATAGTPGNWGPAGATPPATVNDLMNDVPVHVTPTPATPWTTGQYMQTATTGTSGQAHWTGSAWAAGAA